MDRLKDKVVFLTGGGGVLGRASAVLFAREGARIAVVDMVQDKAAETAQRINAGGGEAIALHVDITNETAVREAVETTANHWGHLDTLFNNAGIMPHEDISVVELDVELWSRIYATNVLGTALCCKYAIPYIIQAGGGAVVNMSSFLAMMGCSNPQEAYGASKGAIETEHVRQFFAGETARKLRIDRIPLGRFGRPEDVAEAALFLASDTASWLTGQAIVLDGGISCNYFSIA